MKLNATSVVLAMLLLVCFVFCVYPKNTATRVALAQTDPTTTSVDKSAHASDMSFTVHTGLEVQGQDAPATHGQDARSTTISQRITLWQATVLGIVEGLTEYLPVSSTGHLILTNHAMGMTEFSQKRNVFGPKLEENPALDSFDVVIQLGAILAVVGLYRKRVGQMIGGISAGASAAISRKPLSQIDDYYRAGLKMATLLILAFLPAAVVGKLFHEQIEEHLFGPAPVAYALAVGGVLMIVIEYFFYSRNKSGRGRIGIDQMQYWQALVIGLAQCVAMWPGTSRSMITMLAALVVGLNMVAAAEFSFLLALPTLGAATIYSGLKHHNELLQSAGIDGLIVGLVVSAIVAALAVKGFVKWLTSHGMLPFGVYRIMLAGVLLWYFCR